MYYEINVVKNGRHYFATAERSGRNGFEDMAAKLDHFRSVFPLSEGYVCELRRYTGEVERVDR